VYRLIPSVTGFDLGANLCTRLGRDPAGNGKAWFRDNPVDMALLEELRDARAHDRDARSAWPLEARRAEQPTAGQLKINISDEP
jgi:hypothetical protein